MEIGKARSFLVKGFRHVNAGSSWVTLLVVGVVMVSALAVIGRVDYGVKLCAD